MQITKPSYYDSFSCLAGACPDTCCADWAVVIDKDSLNFYKEVPGKLGRQLREAMTEIGGETCFALQDGRCRLLQPDGLCPIQRELGENRLCKICASYPRFSTEIGLHRELGLSLSCPEAARLILTADTPLTLCKESTDAPMTALHELSPERIIATDKLRTYALRLAQGRSVPFSLRCIRILTLCAPVAAVRRDRALASTLAHSLEKAETLSMPAKKGTTKRLQKALSAAFEHLEYLRSPAALQNALVLPLEGPSWQETCPELPEVWEQLLCYGIYKYFPRTVFDRSLWPAAVFAVALPLLVRQLLRAEEASDGNALLRLSWRLSRELEHSEENMAALFHTFGHRTFRLASLRAAFAAIH